MRICFFTETFLPLVGGAEVVLHHLASELGRRGEEVLVLAPRVRGADNTVDVPYRVRRYARPSSKRFGVRQVLVHLAWIHLRRPLDLLHCHSAYPTGFVGRTFRSLFRVPYVVRPHGSDVLPGERMRRHPRLERRVALALRAADGVVAQGRFLRRVIAELGVEESRLRVIPNGVDLGFFSRGEPFPHARPYILALGNLIPRKGFDILLAAYARLRSPPPADLVVAGEGRERARLEALARELGLAGRVRFLGAVSGRRKVDLYRSAELFVCPSRSEPFANVILEALAAGLAVVASEVGGNPELVHHERHGLLVPPEDPEGLARALERLLGDRKLLGRLRRGAAEFVRRFDWPRVAEEYLELYRQVAPRGGRRGPRRAEPPSRE